MEHLAVGLLRAESAGRGTWPCCFLDLDRFKLVNDGIGHDAGDRLLPGWASGSATPCARTTSWRRFGGDEFIVLCEVSGEEDSPSRSWTARRRSWPRRCRGRLRAVRHAQHRVALSTSRDDARPSVAAAQRRHRHVPGQAGAVPAARRCTRRTRTTSRSESADVERAAPGHPAAELVLHYQPFVDVERLEVVGDRGAGAMASTRSVGSSPPGEFIDLAEE